MRVLNIFSCQKLTKRHLTVNSFNFVFQVYLITEEALEQNYGTPFHNTGFCIEFEEIVFLKLDQNLRVHH